MRGFASAYCFFGWFFFLPVCVLSTDGKICRWDRYLSLPRQSVPSKFLSGVAYLSCNNGHSEKE